MYYVFLYDLQIVRQYCQKAARMIDILTQEVEIATTTMTQKHVTRILLEPFIMQNFDTNDLLIFVITYKS